MNYSPEELTAFRCPACGGMCDLMAARDFKEKWGDPDPHLYFRCRDAKCLAEGRIREEKEELDTVA